MLPVPVLKQTVVQPAAAALVPSFLSHPPRQQDRLMLFMVLGHERCGAVQAALAVKVQALQERSRIALLLRYVLQGLAEVEPQLAPAQQR